MRGRNRQWRWRAVLEWCNAFRGTGGPTLVFQKLSHCNEERAHTKRRKRHDVRETVHPSICSARGRQASRLSVFAGAVAREGVGGWGVWGWGVTVAGLRARRRGRFEPLDSPAMPYEQFTLACST